MTKMPIRITYADFPIDQVGTDPQVALAVIVGTDGPSYRPLGAAMSLRAGQVLAGSLSSGCIERDIALHAMDCVANGRPRRIRYGLGSPYQDIRLPCGGGLDILVMPRMDAAVVAQIAANRKRRRATRLFLSDAGIATTPVADGVEIVVEPDLALHVFGKGPEAVHFAAMAHAAGYLTVLYSPDQETRDAARGLGVDACALYRDLWPDRAVFDRRSAVVLFFHDHEWEPRILRNAALSPAFYIGAQGSLRSRSRRDQELAALGVPAPAIAAMKGPMGIIPRARDARTLAISVLAQIVQDAALPRDMADADDALLCARRSTPAARHDGPTFAQ